MGRRDRHHGSGALLRWFPVVLVLALLAAGVAAYRFDLGARWFGTGEPDPRREPAAVAPPPGLVLPALTAPEPVAGPGDTGQADRAAVARALAPLLADRDLGRHVLVAVGDLDGRGTLYSSGSGDEAAIPASTTKLLTAAAVLEVLGPDHTFTTRVVGTGRRVVLVGGGDPFLEARPDPDAYPPRADLQTLARDTAAALRERGRTRVSLAYDDSLFSGPAENPAWPRDYLTGDVVSPITALWVDEGRAPGSSDRVADPSAAAAQEFARLLAGSGIRVTGEPTRGSAGAGARELARADGAPLGQVVERVVEVSDNEAAEVLARHVGLATSGEGSFTAGTDGVLRTLEGLGVRTDGADLRDGSGLSRRNRLPPDLILDVVRLAAAPAQADLRATLTGLPVAGFSGSLEFRFADVPEAAQGRVRAKTGTLTGVSSLAGVATDRSGTALAFVLMADRVRRPDTLDAREAIDDMAAALAACRCTR